MLIEYPLELNIDLVQQAKFHVNLLKHQHIMKIQIHIDAIIMRKKRSGFMTDKNIKSNPESRPTGNILNKQIGVQERPRIVPVEEIINNYPIDREKIRDIIFLEISKNLTRIANSMEKFFSEVDVETTNNDEGV
jgi:ERCC4-related helicase